MERQLTLPKPQYELNDYVQYKGSPYIFEILAIIEFENESAYRCMPLNDETKLFLYTESKLIVVEPDNGTLREHAMINFTTRLERSDDEYFGDYPKPMMSVSAPNDINAQ